MNIINRSVDILEKYLKLGYCLKIKTVQYLNCCFLDSFFKIMLYNFFLMR